MDNKWGEMWFYSQMMRVSWTQKKTNEEILSMVQEVKCLLKTIIQRQLRFVGHITRENQLEQLCLEGRVEGSRRRGGPRKTITNALALATNMTPNQLLHLTANRSAFKVMVANVRL